MHVQFVILLLVYCFVILLTEVRSIQHGVSFYGLANCGSQRSDDSATLEDSITSTAAADEFPWTAALIYKFTQCEEREAILCTGALIQVNFVLTTAQCVRSPKKSRLDRIRLGEYNITTAQECFTEEHGQECIEFIDSNIAEQIVHPDYNQETQENDIAILKLDHSGGFSDYIRPICLALQASPALREHQTVYISGWGAKSRNEPQSEIKKKIMSDLITNQDCGRAFTSRTINKNHICSTDLRSNKAFTSIGDAGAPVVSKCNRRVWCLIGLFSWTGNDDSKPRVHTRVSEYADWIKANAGL